MIPGFVHLVKITNRKDCCGRRLKNVEIRVGHNETKKTGQSLISRNILCGKYTGPGSNGQTVLINCDPAIEGKYVTIQTLDDTITKINIAEVQVFGNEISGGK